MDIAIVGAKAGATCRFISVKVNCFPTLADTVAQQWSLLAIAPDAALDAVPRGLRADSVLLPGDSAPRFALPLFAGQLVSYGFSPRDTLTLSSFTGSERLLCLQRGILTLGGLPLEPQELPLPPALAALDEEAALFAAGVRLLCGE